MRHLPVSQTRPLRITAKQVLACASDFQEAFQEVHGGMRALAPELLELTVHAQVLEQRWFLSLPAETQRQPRAPERTHEAPITIVRIARNGVMAQPHSNGRQAQEHLHNSADERRLPRRSKAPDRGHVTIFAGPAGAKVTPNSVSVSSREAGKARQRDVCSSRRERLHINDRDAVGKERLLATRFFAELLQETHGRLTSSAHSGIHIRLSVLSGSLPHEPSLFRPDAQGLLVTLLLHQSSLVTKPRQSSATLPLELQVSVSTTVLGMHIEKRKDGKVVREVEPTSALKLLPAPSEVGAATHRTCEKHSVESSRRTLRVAHLVGVAVRLRMPRKLAVSSSR